MREGKIQRPQPIRIRFLTGYAETVAEHDATVLKVCLKSVNHRFLDLHVHLPEGLQALETKVRRGSSGEKHPRAAELAVTLEGTTQATPTVDEAQLGRYVELLRKQGEQYGLSAESGWAALCRLPGFSNAVIPHGWPRHSSTNPTSVANLIFLLQEMQRESNAF